MSAPTTFWHNQTGQNLLCTLNGGATSTALGNWLAISFPNLYGPGAVSDLTGTSNDMAGLTNSQIGNLFLANFYNPVGGSKAEAQILATAFAVFVTSTDLNNTTAGQQAATSDGFVISKDGTAIATFNVGTNGAAFGVANNTTMTILDLLIAVDASARQGRLYAVDPITGQPISGSVQSNYITQAGSVFSTIDGDGGF